MKENKMNMEKNINENYTLPIKFTLEEKEQYRKNGLKEAKLLKIEAGILGPIILILEIVITIYKYMILFGLYENNYWLYKFEHLGMTSGGLSFINIFYDILLYGITVGIIFLLKMIPDNFLKLSLKKIVQKHVEVNIQSNKNVELKLYSGTKILEEEVIDIDILQNRLNELENTVEIKGKKYIVGTNRREEIYDLKEPPKYLSQPEKYKNEMTTVSEILRVIHGIIASFMEQQKEEEWGKKNIQ